MITCSQSSLNNIDKASPSNFRLVFPKIPTESSISAINPFILNIYGAILPSVSFGDEELRWQGNKTRRSGNPLEFDQWTISYNIDSQFANWKLLFDWMSYINDNNDKMAELHSNYSVDCTLVVLDNYTNPIIEIIFVSMYPTNLGEISLSYREGDVLLESTVNFNYDRYYVQSI